MRSQPALFLGARARLVGAIMRMHTEEQLLLESFGEQYMAYKRAVPAFIPYIP